MKVFIMGLPQSGKTTIAKSLAENLNNKYQYIAAVSWIKGTFRDPGQEETLQQYNENYHQYLIERLKDDPDMVIRNVESYIRLSSSSNFIIDGVYSPKDFSALFDYNEDVVVFLNRTDAEPDCLDYERIGISVTRDYCFWLASAGLLPKERWLEFNFKIPGSDSKIIKKLGCRNSVIIVSSIYKVIEYLLDLLNGAK